MTIVTLIASLLGGSIALLLKHVVCVPIDVRRNDATIKRRDDDLTRWIGDDARAVENDYSAKMQQANAQGVLEGGFPTACRRVLCGLALHRYRDQLVDAERVVEDVRLQERWTHRTWRAVRHLPLPELSAPGRRADVLAEWHRGSVIATVARPHAAL